MVSRVLNIILCPPKFGLTESVRPAIKPGVVVVVLGCVQQYIQIMLPPITHATALAMGGRRVQEPAM